MNMSFYNAAVGAQQQQLRMNVQSNNIANVNTQGYRAERAAFGELMNRNVVGIDDARLPKGTGARMIHAPVDFTSRGFMDTGKTFDFAINGDGFFALFDPETQEISFTRDGSFTMTQFWIPPAEDAEPELDENGEEIAPQPTSVWRLSDNQGRCVLDPQGNFIVIDPADRGAALELSAEEIEPAVFEGYDCLYMEGYLVQNHALIRKAAETAKACGLKVALDLASFNIVDENRDFLRALVAEHVDILFANEDEAKAFTGEAEPLNALQSISELCPLAVVKIGTRGALIKNGGHDAHVHHLAAKRVDTTGAGDFYAAGFLSGLCSGLTLRQCGTIGAITAGKVIEVVGTTFGEEAWDDVFRLVRKVEHEKYLF